LVCRRCLLITGVVTVADLGVWDIFSKAVTVIGLHLEFILMCKLIILVVMVSKLTMS
jgi:hypothetical protein